MENAFPWGPLIVMALFIGGGIALVRYVRKRRRDAMADMASRLGLNPVPDDSLPSDLSLRGTPFDEWEGTSNIFCGLINGREIAVLDVSKAIGRGSWTRTVLAVKTADEVQEDWYGFHAERVGAWVLFYQPAGFLRYPGVTTVADVELRLSALASRAEVRS